MELNLGRRRFLQAASALGLGAGLGTWASLKAITPARAEDLVVGPDAARFRPEIEPVVRWIEETPRAQALEKAVAELKAGLSYRDLLAGLFLAGIRNIQPRPVGFKFHAVMVMNSAHLLAHTAVETDRLLPMLWALDNFKASQLADIREGDWTLATVDEAHLPRPGQARSALIDAMEAWDSDKADVATAALCRSAGAAETMEPFWRYAVRDQRNIGHKPIFAMQCWRTLQTIGWQHAEPVLRSLSFGMLDLQGSATPSAVGPYDANLARAPKIRDEWQVGRLDCGATQALLETIRHAEPDEASAQVVELLNDGVAPASLWDAVMLAGSELMIRKPGIVSLHAMTAANALHYIFGASGDDTTRRLALLQAAGWMPLYREYREQPRTAEQIDALEPIAPEGSGEEALADVFATADSDRTAAARKALGYLQAGGPPEPFFDAARRLIFYKGADNHQYKYGAAAWEEFLLASDPTWQAPLAATMLTYVPSSGASDSSLMRRAREAVDTVLGGRASVD